MDAFDGFITGLVMGFCIGILFARAVIRSGNQPTQGETP